MKSKLLILLVIMATFSLHLFANSKPSLPLNLGLIDKPPNLVITDVSGRITCCLMEHFLPKIGYSNLAVWLIIPNVATFGPVYTDNNGNFRIGSAMQAHAIPPEVELRINGRSWWLSNGGTHVVNYCFISSPKSQD